MFVVILRFAENKGQASAFMDAHNQWIKRGFDDGIFLMVGSLKPGLGGSIIAHGVPRETIEARVSEDPFVTENIVSAEILEIDPKKADERLKFLMS